MSWKIKREVLKLIGQANYNSLSRMKNKSIKIVKKAKWKRKYKHDLAKYELLNQRDNFRYISKYRRPILGEWAEDAGTLGPYFWQDLWAAAHINKKNPKEHYDIGSSIQGFIAHLCSFRENIRLIDVRPLSAKLPGVTFVQDDASSLRHLEDQSVESLSSLCAVEHFGLGRYGDKIDPEGCFRALNEMQRVIKQGGMLYLSVPIGWEHLEFNAHRVFYPQTIVESLPEMKLIEFSTTGYFGDYIRYNEDIHKYDNYDTTNGTLFGLFLFEKV